MKPEQKEIKKGRQSRTLNQERWRYIVQKVNQEGRVLVTDLAGELDISPVTIRNDLKVLSREGLLERTHGGAIKSESALIDRALREKEKIHAQEKSAIAAKAATYIHEGQSIILDSGSTATKIARMIRDRKDLTVITNAVNIALELLDTSGIEVILTGGVLRRNSVSLVGHLSEVSLHRLTADIMFMGVDGIDAEIGYTTPNLSEARVNQEMMKITREIIVVSDSSKFGRRSLAVICEPRRVHRIITDSKVDSEYVNQLQALDVEVVLVDTD
ncbi:MAG: transcriptional repressor AgaR [Acidobacteriota bacterium]